MGISIERIIHSIKTALACLIGFAIIKAFHAYLIFDQWLIVTILVVMCAQLSVGSVFYKSTLRFMGTCVGSLLAAFTLIAFGDNPLAYALVIAFAGMIFSFLATSQKSYSDAATLGAVTTAIILINPNPTLALTAERFIEISIGIVIATLISQFVLPIHARIHLRRNQAQTLRLLGEYYAKATATQPAEKENMIEIDEDIVQSLLTQRKLAQEAKRELLGSRFEPDRFKRLLESEKRILRSVDFLNNMYNEPTEHYVLHNNIEWMEFNKKIHTVFSQLATFVERPEPQHPPIEIPTLGNLKTEIAKIADLAPEDRTHAHALFVCLENIISLLKELSLIV